MNGRDRESNDSSRPVGSLGGVGLPGTGIDDDDDEDRLPAHEIDEDETVGGGVLSQGGTAIDRGTGTLAGQAQGEVDPDDDGHGVGIED
jgi:hypothetical protein